MERLLNIKSSVFIAFGAIGGFMGSALGGNNPILKGFLIAMAVDYVTGLVVALIFKNSPKTETGAAQSKAGFIGLIKKAFILLIIVVVNQVI